MTICTELSTYRIVRIPLILSIKIFLDVTEVEEYQIRIPHDPK